MSAFTKNKSFLEYKLKNLKFWLAKTKCKHIAEVNMFRTFKQLYEKDKKQLANMDRSPSDIDEQLYEFVCMERDDNRMKARASQVSYRTQRKSIDKLQGLIQGLEISIQEMTDNLQTKLINYEALFNLCLVEERELLLLKEECEARQKEMHWVINLRGEAVTDSDTGYFHQRAQSVGARCEVLDQKYRDSSEVSLSLKQELIDKSVALITQWINGDTTGKAHIMNLWETCVLNPAKSTDTSVSTIIRELMKNNMDILQECYIAGDLTIQRSARNTLILPKEDNRDWLYISDVRTKSADVTTNKELCHSGHHKAQSGKTVHGKRNHAPESKKSNKHTSINTPKPWL
ncbi:hypothetical protein ScPMuIL_010005 [Solemya velum]